MPPADFPSSSCYCPSHALRILEGNCYRSHPHHYSIFLGVRLPLEISGTTHTKDNGWSNFPRIASCFSPCRAPEAPGVEIPEKWGKITKFLSPVQPPKMGQNYRKITQWYCRWSFLIPWPWCGHAKTHPNCLGLLCFAAHRHNIQHSDPHRCSASGRAGDADTHATQASGSSWLESLDVFLAWWGCFSIIVNPRLP